MLPFAHLLLPYTSFLHGHRRRFSVGDLLGQTNIGDHGRIPHDPDMGSDDGRLNGRRSGWQIEIVLVKIQSVDKIPHRLGFKARQARATDFLVGIPIATGDRNE